VIEEAVGAIRAGRPVVLPTDTVYGLCAEPSADAASQVARLKGRYERQPIALVARSVETLLELVPELPERTLGALLPGQFTLILPDPKGRYPWLGGEGTIGVRVPDLPPPAAAVLDQVGAVLATSANLHGGPDPCRLEDVPEEIRRAAVLVDGGELPGTPSTVVDLTGPEPRVLREGAVPAAEALSAVRSARAAGARATERT
jgi:tRNA threonylcarbamoyl adenosine modification protein (Sua5/YciO/YrdC/YwlC family)